VGPTCQTPRPRQARAAAHRCRVAAMRHVSHARLKAAIGTVRRASRQPDPRARPDRLADRAVAPTALPTAPSPRPPCRLRRRLDRSRSPVDAVPRRRPHASEPPVPRRRLPHAGRPRPWAVHAGCASDASMGRAPRGCGLCNWAESGFGPLAPG
jgi:hypothetical protein